MKKLDDIPKKEPFKAPEGYFDSFEDRLKTRIDAKKETQRTSLWQAVKPYFYFAAFFAAIVFLLKIGINQFTDKYNNESQNANIAQSESLYYEYEFISDDMIYDELTASADSSENELSEEAIAAYLSDEEIEYLLYE
jgi:hypothetical protein